MSVTLARAAGAQPACVKARSVVLAPMRARRRSLEDYGALVAGEEEKGLERAGAVVCA